MSLPDGPDFSVPTTDALLLARAEASLDSLDSFLTGGAAACADLEARSGILGVDWIGGKEMLGARGVRSEALAESEGGRDGGRS